MIYDAIAYITQYKGISKNLDTAISFLVATDLNTLPLGKTEIDGEQVFINVMEAETKPREVLNFEAHKKYMDIQIVLDGVEIIESAVGQIREIEEYNPVKDIGFYEAEETVSCKMVPGRFILLMAEELHRPCIRGCEDIRIKKCVIKVAK